MIKKRQALIFVLMMTLLRWTSTGEGYDLRTHGEVTGRSFDNSQNTRIYLDAVGIKTTDIFDSQNRTPPRQMRDFDNTGTPHDWMIEGAIREDDFQPHINCDQPQNPPSDIDRPLNHFFDVQRGGAGLTVLGFQRGFPAPDWALGRQGRGSSTTQNQFSILDARVYQLKSLTEAKKDDRERNTALFFRTLGQVAHVLQDMAQPQHTRNDPHAGCFPQFLTGEHSVYEDYIEARARGARFRTRGQPAPPLLLDGYAPPRFSIYQDFWTTVEQKGLADFSSRNFFSAGTNLSFFSFFGLGRCGGLSEPRCSPTAYTRRATPFSFTTIDNKVIAGTVTLFLHDAQDRLTGQTIPNVAVSSRSVWDQHLENRGFFPVFSLNTLNYDSIGDVLLPRAVGYSAGLLDYFFRGKLDVDLVQDPNSTDPTVVKLSGTNGSPDKLDGGTLTLYADNPVTGERSLVPALEPNFTVVADKGQPVESAKFQINAEAERFMAVYKGKLGNEAPQGDFPGGVIGKVLGGVRAESIFVQGNKRMLRTVDGVFPLPPDADRLENIRWGDLDNTFVGILSNPATPRSPDQILAFKINRPLGSGEAPLVDGPGGTQVVSAEVLKAVNFPFGLSLGVTVNYSQSIQFRQFLFTYQHIVPSVWDGQHYVLDFTRDVVIGPTEAEIVIDETFPFAQNFSIILDQAHRFGGSTSIPYSWSVQEVAFDRQGRILALVKVFLGAPDSNRRTVKLWKRNQQCQLVEDAVRSQEIRASIRGGPIWALIDVEKAEVLGVSSSPNLSPLTQSAFSRFLIQERFIAVHSGGGPLDGSVSESCVEPNEGILPNPSVPTVETARITVPREGTLSQQLTGKFRADLEPLISVEEISTISSERVLVYSVEGSSRTNRAIRLVTPISIMTRTVSLPFSPLVQMVRPTREGGSAEIVFLFEQVVFNGQRTTPIEPIFIRWSPEFPSKTGPAIPEKLPASDFFIFSSATPRAALLEFFDWELVALSVAIVDFDSGTFEIFPDQFLSRNYVLLDPKFLYNINDTKFHTLDPSLRPTVLPRSLAPAPAVFFPRPTYHLIRLR